MSQSQNTVPFHHTIILIALLIALFFQLFFAMQDFSPVVDEITHIASGYSYLKTGTITLNPEHPPLIKIIAALPLLFLHVHFDNNDPDLVGPKPDQWKFGIHFFLQNNTDQILFFTRLPMVLIALALGYIIFRWARELYHSTTAGLLALSLYTFTPLILGHGTWVTTDVGVSATVTLFFYCLYRYLQSMTRQRLLICGITLGLALASKFSALIVVPIALAIIALHLVITKKQQNYARLSKLFLISTTTILCLSALTVWTLYFFPHNMHFYTDGIHAIYGEQQASYPYYLNGTFKPGGWWYYFVVAWLLKTPIPILLITIGGIITTRFVKTNIVDTLILLVPPIAITIITSIYAHDIGARYMIPVYPFLYVYAARLGTLFDHKKIKMPVAALIVWSMVISIAAFPNYLSYFNEIGGGHEGYRHLDDSNIEWGQDLKALSAFSHQHPNALIVYPWIPSYQLFPYYGIDPQKNLFYAPTTPQWWRSPHGMYIVSTHYLVRAQIVSRYHHDPSLDWLNKYKPSDRIGGSFLVYDFP